MNNGHAHRNGRKSQNGAGQIPDAALYQAKPRRADLLKLLYPGVGIKRWLLLGSTGISLCSVGLMFLLRKLLALGAPGVLPLHLEGILLLGSGVAVILLALYGLYRSIGPLIFAKSSIDGIANTIYTRRALGKGPKIVAIGGGTGLSVLLRGLKAYTDNLTAIVTVADDGGSSGRLRDELGVLPPGDFRNCLVAMSEDEPLLRELFQYRFDQGDGLKGHSFGNLFIVALTDVTKSFEQALYESSRVLAVQGRIVPSTGANIQLGARFADGVVVMGESSISARGGEIEGIFIEPASVEPHPLALEAIREADIIVIGPGSLYTSIMPNLLVPGIAGAIRESSAIKLHVCNVATQKGETEGYSVADHLDALQRHTFATIVDYIIANSNPIELGPQFYGRPVTDDGRPLHHASLVLGDIMNPEHRVRHDSAKLAQIIMDVYHSNKRKLKQQQKLSSKLQRIG